MRAALPWLVLASLLACDDDPTPSADAGLALEAVAEDLEPIVLGVWGSDAEDLWFVGGGPGGRWMGHLEGDVVEPVAVPEGATLWWVWGASKARVWACGDEGGLITREGGEWRAEASGLGEKAVLYGLWGSSETDLWAVGGSYRRGGPTGLVMRSSGDGTWTRVEDPAFPERNFYKVWGRGPDDVLIVGDQGTSVHWDGTSFTRVDAPEANLLFTLHGAGDTILAVGGIAKGLAYRFEGGAWIPEELPDVGGLNGVFVQPEGRAIAAGLGGVVVERVDGEWRERPHDVRVGRGTLHAVWGTPPMASLAGRARLWFVGGDFLGQKDGLIAREVQ